MWSTTTPIKIQLSKVTPQKNERTMTLIEKIKPYVYHITHEPTGVCYVGSRGSNKVTSKEDFWNIYFTSSVKVKGLIEEYGVESFKIDWITEYETSQQAVEEEEKFQHIKNLGSPQLCWLAILC